MKTRLTRVVIVVLVALAGCQAPAPAPEPVPPPPPPAAPAPPPPQPSPPPAKVPTPAERAVSEGVALYDAGDFNGTIKTLLAAKAIWDDASADGVASKVAAHKVIAFSYCVTNRRTQCRQQFVNALKLDPNFTLQPAEKTHPVWGPEFERAKAQLAAPAPPARRPPTTAPASPPAKAP
jgi:hypothetical protein